MHTGSKDGDIVSVTVPVKAELVVQIQFCICVVRFTKIGREDGIVSPGKLLCLLGDNLVCTSCHHRQDCKEKCV